MTDKHVSIGEFVGAFLICAHAGIRALIVISGLQWTRAGRRIYR